ncbi:hypothetical protein C0J56_22190 [Pseudomonas fluorescens]|nr:hypothetical protein C0J56_22190 [Pseudomonas fluorescens]
MAKTLWRGDLSPLGCVAAPCVPSDTPPWQIDLGAASRPSGDKSPRHKVSAPIGEACSLATICYLSACNASSLAITPAAVCSPSNCSRTLPWLSMM